MGKMNTIMKSKLLWVIAALLLFWAFPRPIKWAGRFFIAKIIPNMALIANIISTVPLNKIIGSRPEKIMAPNSEVT
jgi:hypothetical protein